MANNWKHAMPVYVTRTTAGGETGSFSISIWMVVLVGMLVWLNTLAWSVIGIIKAVEVLV